MDYFPIFFTIVGCAVVGGLTLFSVIVYITSREPHPPVRKPVAVDRQPQAAEAVEAAASEDLAKTAA